MFTVPDRSVSFDCVPRTPSNLLHVVSAPPIFLHSYLSSISISLTQLLPSQPLNVGIIQSCVLALSFSSVYLPRVIFPSPMTLNATCMPVVLNWLGVTFTLHGTQGNVWHCFACHKWDLEEVLPTSKGWRPWMLPNILTMHRNIWPKISHHKEYLAQNANFPKIEKFLLLANESQVPLFSFHQS